MLLSESIPFIKTWSIPGKVFLLGEYAVLSGESAWIATLGPRFWLDATQVGSVKSSDKILHSAPFVASSFASESPAGRLFALAQKQSLPEFLVRFDDPLLGSGGFVASTAQFALLHRALSEACPEVFEAGWLACWKTYRELMGGSTTGPGPASGKSAMAPSGADLAAQAMGGVCFFDPRALTCERQEQRSIWQSFLVFSAAWQPGRKAATHLHLADLDRRDAGLADFARELAPVLATARKAIETQDLLCLGSALEDYGNALADLGLEIAATRADREAIRKISGVLGVKGAGALQADAIVVLVDPGRAVMPELIATIEKRGLRFVGTADSCEPGVRREEKNAFKREG